MIDSPLLKELMAENTRETIRNVLVGRFGHAAETIQPALDRITDDRKLKALARKSGVCPDLEAFRDLLQVEPKKRK
jgi:hypothetical protein